MKTYRAVISRENTLCWRVYVHVSGDGFTGYYAWSCLTRWGARRSARRYLAQRRKWADQVEEVEA